jgi:cbb3-type cytochrome oxidase subunit 3
MSKNKRGRKGISLGQIPQILMIMMLIGIFVGVTYITLVAFQNSQVNTSKAYSGIGYVITMMDNLATNLPTIGIMIFVGILISVVFWMVASGKIGGKGKGGGA